MRSICWAFALASVGALTAPADGFEGHGYAAPCPKCSYYPSHMVATHACPVTMGHGWQPGCCECPPSCCDNVWAGYCQEKVQFQAFWDRVKYLDFGRCRGRGCVGGYGCGCGSTVVVSQSATAEPLEPPDTSE